MSDTLYIKPDKEKTYSVNSEEELNYYKSLRPIRLWSRTHFKCKCSKCHEDKDILLLNLKFPFICFKCKAKIVGNKESTKERRKATCLAKYGVENTFQSEEKKTKIRQTCKERYGVEVCSQNPEVYAKVKKTNIERYGYTCSLNTEENLTKRKETWLKTLGVDNPNKSNIIKNKSRKTMLEKYGVEYYTQTKEYKQRSMKSKLEKYGDAFYSGLVIYYYDNNYFRSKPELCFYIYHKDNNIPVVYEPTPYIEYEYEGKQHFYKPDFLVENKLYEIKGDQFFKENKMVCPFDHNLDGLYEAKHQCMLKNNVTILKYKDYIFYVDYINEKYGSDYLNKFKLKK